MYVSVCVCCMHCDYPESEWVVRSTKSRRSEVCAQQGPTFEVTQSPLSADSHCQEKCVHQVSHQVMFYKPVLLTSLCWQEIKESKLVAANNTTGQHQPEKSMLYPMQNFVPLQRTYCPVHMLAYR